MPPLLEDMDVRNRYVLSTLLSLEESQPPATQLAPQDLAVVRLTDYLQRCADRLPPGADLCLLFDQFEELFTLDPVRRAERSAFLEELGVALRDRGRWALFAMREDFIAQLDPHLSAMPTRFSTRYRLDLLGPAAATLAARAPAEADGVAFTEDAADRLVDDLRRVTVQRDGVAREELGPSVEPVQLQVVCRQLWDTLSPDDRSIEVADVEALGDVDDALADFYVDQVKVVAQKTGVGEREIRNWFDEALITAQGFRAQALEGPGANGDEVLRELEDAHLIRADPRRGARWYELAHDRLVAPIRASNIAWRAEHLNTLQREAQVWDHQSRPHGLLMTGKVLAEAEEWASAHDDELSALDRDYLDACRAEAQRAAAERRAAQRNRRLAIVACAVGILAIIGLIAALLLWYSATTQGRKARFAEANAIGGQAQALGTSDPPLALALAAEAYERHPSESTTPALGDTYDAFIKSGLVRTLTGHSDSVSGIAYDSDGSLLASASDDGTIRLWDPANGREVRALKAHQGAVTAVAFGADGSLLASGGDDGTVRLWNPTTGEPTHPRLTGDGKPVLGVAVSGSGHLVAGAGEGNVVQLWNLETGELSTLEGHSAAVTSVSFSADEALLASSSRDGTVIVWDVETGKALKTLGDAGPGGPNQSYRALTVAFSPGGLGRTLAVGGSDRTVRLWDVSSSPRELFTLTGHGARVPSVAFSPDGGSLASGSGDGTVKLWDVATGRELRTLAGHRKGVNGVAFAPDGSQVASASDDRTVKLWDPRAALEHGTLPTGGNVLAVAVSPDRTRVASGGVDKTITVWNPASGQTVRLEGHTDRVNDVAFNDDGSLLASASGDKTVRLWPLTTGGPATVAARSDKGVRTVAFSPDGTHLAFGGGGRTVEVLDVTAGGDPRRLGRHGQAVTALAFSPDGKLLASGSDDTTVKVWPLSGGRPRTLKGPDDGVTGVAFSPDSSLLAASSDDGKMWVWDLDRGGKVRTFTAGEEPLRAVAFSPDGTLVVGAGDDRMVRVWDVATGYQLRAMTGHGDPILALGTSAKVGGDGWWLASGSSDGTVKLWEPKAVSAEDACRLVGPHLSRDTLVKALLGPKPQACTKLR